jgi:hypothetical protein
MKKQAPKSKPRSGRLFIVVMILGQSALWILSGLLLLLQGCD